MVYNTNLTKHYIIFLSYSGSVHCSFIGFNNNIFSFNLINTRFRIMFIENIGLIKKLTSLLCIKHTRKKQAKVFFFR